MPIIATNRKLDPGKVYWLKSFHQMIGGAIYESKLSQPFKVMRESTYDEWSRHTPNIAYVSAGSDERLYYYEVESD